MLNSSGKLLLSISCYVEAQ